MTDEPSAKDALEHAEAIGRAATERAAAADRRATMIAGAVSIAAALSISGAGLVLDGTKLTHHGLRVAVAIALVFATASFVASAIYALRALVVMRVWNWSLPKDLPVDSAELLQYRIGMRAAHLINDFSWNWEIADLKDRAVDRAVGFLGAGLIGVVGLVVTILIAVL